MKSEITDFVFIFKRLVKTYIGDLNDNIKICVFISMPRLKKFILQGNENAWIVV